MKFKRARQEPVTITERLVIVGSSIDQNWPSELNIPDLQVTLVHASLSVHAKQALTGTLSIFSHRPTANDHCRDDGTYGDVSTSRQILIVNPDYESFPRKKNRKKQATKRISA